MLLIKFDIDTLGLDFYVSIATNTSIKTLSFVSTLPPFLRGEQRGVRDGLGLTYTLMSDWLGNNSVETVTMPVCDGECVMDNSEENRKLARVLSSFSSLKHFQIEFAGNDYGDDGAPCDVAVQIIYSFSNHPNLEKVYFTFTHTLLGSSGYTALAKFLANSKVKKLGLEKGFTDEGAVAVCDMLEGNQTLEELILDDFDSPRLSTAGCKAFSRLLGNDSGTIMDTFNANHTLQKLFSSDYFGEQGNESLPEDLQLSLRINTLCNKSDAARIKIILGHNFRKGDFDAEPFDNMDLSVMPYMLAWMGRTNADVAPLYRFADADLCLMFKFVRGMAPTLFDSPASASAGKRKLQQM